MQNFNFFYIYIIKTRDLQGHNLKRKLGRGSLLKYSPSNGTLFFGNNIKSEMDFNQKTLTKNIFFEVCIRFHKCLDRMEF